VAHRQDDFELLTELGTGGTSAVYAARVRAAAQLAPSKDDLVVLKVMSKRRLVEMQALHLAQQECAILEHIQGSRFVLNMVRARVPVALGVTAGMPCVRADDDVGALAIARAVRVVSRRIGDSYSD
jgi:hypothetical protein